MPIINGHIFEKASQSLDMPLDVVAGLPRAEIRGGHEVIIESHCGIREYGQLAIVVDTPSGCVRVSGADLTIRSMNEERIVINGVIGAFEYI